MSQVYCETFALTFFFGIKTAKLRISYFFPRFDFSTENENGLQSPNKKKWIWALQTNAVWKKIMFS